MSTKLKGPDGATHVQVDGIDYDVGEDGLFDIDNGGHVETLCGMGFLTEEQTTGVCAELQARFPRVIHGMVQSGINISTVHTAEGLLDVIEGQLPKTPEQIEAEEGTIVGETVLEPEEPAEGEGEQEPNPDVNDQAEGEQTDGEQGTEGEESGDETGGEGQEAPAAEIPALADVPKDDIGNPTFNKMNRGGIHAWLVANGGTELAPNAAKDDLITEAEARADALIAAARGE